ncbi:MAG: hypothetical protein WBX14_06615 [Candidatus Udaeobacter sp.]
MAGKNVTAGQIELPIGKVANVHAIWIFDKDPDVAGLVTAYPQKR